MIKIALAPDRCANVISKFIKLVRPNCSHSTVASVFNFTTVTVYALFHGDLTQIFANMFSLVSFTSVNIVYQTLSSCQSDTYKRLQVDKVCGRDAESVGVPLDVVLHDVAVWIVHHVGVSRIGRGPQFSYLEERQL